MVLRGLCAAAGLVMIAGCGAEASTGSTVDVIDPGASLATSPDPTTTSASASTPATTNAITSASIATASIETPSTAAPDTPATTTIVVTTTTMVATSTVVPTAAPVLSREAQAVSDALDSARTRWVDAQITSYQLSVAAGTVWAADTCREIDVVSDGVVSASELDPVSVAAGCSPVEWTVDYLHDIIAGWLDDLRQYGSPEPGIDTLDVEFSDIGVPVAIRYDLASSSDEEMSAQVTFTPTP